MLTKFSVRQSFRAPVRLLASFLVVALVCAFLGIFAYSKSVQRKRCDVEITEIVKNASR